MGATVTWDVVVLAVGVTGTEAAFSADQIKTVAVQAYANYAPLSQPMPTVTVLNDDQVSLKGTYTRPSNTPMPVAVNIYKSESATDSANLVAKVPLQPSNDPTIYNWHYDVQSLKTQFANAGVSLIVVRYALENGTESSNANKNVVKVLTQAPGTAPILSGAAAYVKTIGASVSNGTDTLTFSTGSYTPGNGGTGTLLTLTPPLNNIILEVSDGGGTPGLNPENITPSIDGLAPSFSLIATPTKNTGTRNIRARFSTVYGMSGYSNAIQITFPVDNVVDSTPPDLTPCQPRFVCNADGSIKITWSAASFGSSGLGSYAIRRSATNDVNASYTVGLTTTSTTLSWTDALPSDKQGYTYYYWLEATSAQGVKSASPIAVKLSSANTYAAETVTGAASVDSAPATPTGLTIKGAQGGFDITWSNNTERDLSYYSLEFSANGTMSDAVVVSRTKGNSYFQTLGATVAKAVADVYRWRIRAVDFGGNASAVSALASPDNTNYGSVQDSAPNTPTSTTTTTDTNGTATVSVVLPADTNRAYVKLVRRSYTSDFTDSTGGAVTEATYTVPNDGAAGTITWMDSGLVPNRWYMYRVYSRSKLGTDSDSYVVGNAARANYQVRGVLRPNLVSNGHFGTASGAYGTSYSGWTLTGGVTTTPTSKIFQHSGTDFNLMQFTHSGSTSSVMLSQPIQVIAGRRYTVMALVYYEGTDGNAYVKVFPAVSPSDSSDGLTSLPAPYSSATKEANASDATSVRNGFRVITYSFTAPLGYTSVTIQIGYANRGTTTPVSIYPGFVQVFCDD